MSLPLLYVVDGKPHDWLQSALAVVIAMVADGMTTQGGYTLFGRCYGHKW